MDTLGDLSGASDDSDGEETQPEERPRKAARTEPDIDPEALVCGASVLFVPEPKAEEGEQWGWCA